MRTTLCIYNEYKFCFFIYRLSDDVPAQSDSIPLFNIYFTGCMVFALCSLIWFYQMNNLKTNQKISASLRFFVLKFACTILRRKPYKLISSESKGILFLSNYNFLIKNS